MIGWKPTPFIFVHVPKCAGTSIEKALLAVATDRSSFKELSENERTRFWLPGGKCLQHSKIRRYARHFQLENFFKFAFVRNPWDRAISQINYLRSIAGRSAIPGKTFKEQLKVYCRATRNICGHDLSACQIDYLVDALGQMRVDFVGRFETLATDFEKICGSIGISPALSLPHVFNSQRSRHYSDFYDDEAMGWVASRFAKDIEYFGYPFERPSLGTGPTVK